MDMFRKRYFPSNNADELATLRARAKVLMDVAEAARAWRLNPHDMELIRGLCVAIDTLTSTDGE